MVGSTGCTGDTHMVGDTGDRDTGDDHMVGSAYHHNQNVMTLPNQVEKADDHQTQNQHESREVDAFQDLHKRSVRLT